MCGSVADQSLIEAAISGDRPALEHLLWRHYNALERYIAPRIPPHAQKHFSVEDILQTVFTQAFREIGRFEPRGEGAFLGWLRTIAEHRLIDALRKLGRGGLKQVSVGAADSQQSIHNLLQMLCSEGE